MEQAKDTQRTESLSKFIENQHVKTSPFADNRMGERIYRRVEKIAAALVLVTNHVSDKEPLRNRARTMTTELISASLLMRDDMRSLNSERVRGFKAVTRELISLIRLLAIAGEISMPNADAIAEALDELSVFLATSQRSTLSESVSYTKEDLADTREIMLASRKEQTLTFERHPKSEVHESQGKDTKNVSPGVQMPVSADPGAASPRSLVILEILRPGGEFSIRDIAANLPEYSEKMIQRELAVLVSLGKVAKKGEKRWSRYSFLGGS